MAVNAEWNDEHTRIVCELFAEQVLAGNRPSTHLNNIGYNEVTVKFQEKTGYAYTKKQLKNKWEKLRAEYNTWKKLLTKATGLGWNSAKGTVAADDDWWKKTNKDLPGVRKFKKAGIQNEEYLRVMFDGHSPLATGSIPSILDSTPNVVSLDGINDNNEDSQCTRQGLESPPSTSGKGTSNANSKKRKKTKLESTSSLQAHMKRLIEVTEKSEATYSNFVTRVDSPGCGIQEVMSLVRECGATGGTNEHFIATELFIISEQREMFLTMSTAKERFEWLRRKYQAKYGH